MQEAINQMNTCGKERTPFFFMVDFEMKSPVVITYDKLFPKNLLFDIDGFSNAAPEERKQVKIAHQPISFSDYQKAFDLVQKEQRHGNSYLTNLTFKTPIKSEASLKDIFYASKARFKLLYKDEFVVFSPEIFITIKDGVISTNPMKGTIDADIPGAEQIILDDPKEKAEHYTIVDLLRNDLSMVAKKVRVKKFRYIDHLKTSRKNLLQVSSEITGQLPDNYHEQLGDILFTILPAGSVSGAPKKKTLEIIKSSEKEDRGYYTGVAGFYDGQSLKSFVMIRFISKQNDQLFYHSGGGITVNSLAEKEFEELNDKIYVPVI